MATKTYPLVWWPTIQLLTFSPILQRWQVAGHTNNAPSAKEAARRFKKLHPEQIAAAQYDRPGARLVRP